MLFSTFRMTLLRREKKIKREREREREREERETKGERKILLLGLPARLNFNVFHPLCIPNMADAGHGDANLRY